MKILNDSAYIEELRNVLNINISWDKLANKNVLITGATGLIGSYLVDVFMARNTYFNENICVYAMSRKKENLQERFEEYYELSKFIPIEGDVCNINFEEFKFDFIIHAASNADPIKMSTDPVGTMKGNFLGACNLLESAKRDKARILYLSSGEVYGENPGNIEEFIEGDSGNIYWDMPRACYPESKRATETMCISYEKQYGVDVVIARLCYIYGPTLLKDDSRVYAQFINNVLENKGIVMKSEGLQYRSYCYISDSIKALLYILTEGVKGEIYNVANDKSNTSIRGIAEKLSKLYNLNIKEEIPTLTEKNGYSLVTKAILNADKLKNLGWIPDVSLEDGLRKTVDILKRIRG